MTGGRGATVPAGNMLVEMTTRRTTVRRGTRRTRVVRGVLGLVLVPVLLAGCSGGSDAGPAPQPTLVVPTGSTPFTCQEHQEQPPGSDYAGGTEADTARVLTLLRYWNENGDKPYCDGEPATEIDPAWADLVQRLLDNEPAPTTTPAPATTT